LRLVTTGLLLAVGASVAFAPALPPTSPALLILSLPMWAAAYVGFALLYAALEAPRAVDQRHPESDDCKGIEAR
jgi:hypothetical protein